MKKRFLAMFSGFPERRFSEEITERLRRELTVRKSIVFITACPLDYEQNDEDCDGMHHMFVEQGLGFENHCVIDKRMEPSKAKELVEKADCIFLMGGGVCEEQLDLIREKDCYEALINGHSAVFGVSAGSMNMAKDTVDFFESLEAFPGLGLTNMTVTCHHDPSDTWRFEKSLQISEKRVVYVMEDLSAFFVKDGKIDTVGKIYRAENRELKPISEEDIRELELYYQKYIDYEMILNGNEVELITKDLILRTPAADDLSELARMWDYPKGVTEEDASGILKWMEGNRAKNKHGAIYHLCLGVFEKKEPKRIIGWCGLDGTAAPGQTVLFYIIDEKYRCKGYATECAEELLRFAFEDMGYESIYSGCAEDNIASYRVMEKAGMRLISRTGHGGYNFVMDKEGYLNGRKNVSEGV